MTVDVTIIDNDVVPEIHLTETAGGFRRICEPSSS